MRTDDDTYVLGKGMKAAGLSINATHEGGERSYCRFLIKAVSNILYHVPNACKVALNFYVP